MRNDTIVISKAYDMQKKKLRRILFIGIITGLVASLSLIMLSRHLIASNASGKTYTDASLLPNSKVALILGCSKHLRDGRDNLFFIHRMNAAVEVYQAGKVEYLLVSGDNNSLDYDEPGEMKAALIARGIPAHLIFCDDAGFSTYDSVIRAKKVFGQNQLIVVSQEFHNHRAIYIGSNRGIEVFGYNAAEVDTFNAFKTKLREQFAKVKTVLDISILGREPQFLGDPVDIGRHINSGDGYHLVWADEFETDGAPNPMNWTYEQGFVRNKELQWYQLENAVCEDGLLVIEGRKERKRNPNYQDGSKDWKKNRAYAEYTSACLTTQGIHSWQYGRFEVKARIRAENGLWPAIWFLGVDGEWPSNGEIDLMEFYGGNILANACWGTKTRWKAKWDASKKPVAQFKDPKWDETFHIWRMDWDSDSIRLYLDDQLLNTIDLAKTLNPTDRGPKNPFKQPHYLLLNLAIGGDAGGDPSKTTFPTKYEIDYVRVYQKESAIPL